MIDVIKASQLKISPCLRRAFMCLMTHTSPSVTVNGIDVWTKTKD